MTITPKSAICNHPLLVIESSYSLSVLSARRPDHDRESLLSRLNSTDEVRRIICFSSIRAPISPNAANARRSIAKL
jgi:hypothetical protein